MAEPSLALILTIGRTPIAFRRGKPSGTIDSCLHCPCKRGVQLTSLNFHRAVGLLPITSAGLYLLTRQIVFVASHLLYWKSFTSSGRMQSVRLRS